MKLDDAEQTVHAFLEQQGRRKLQCKIKWGLPVEATGVAVSGLHEIWQIEGKRHSACSKFMIISIA